MNDRIFQSFCKVGEAADDLYREGRFRDAHDAYVRLLHEVESSGMVDSYVVSKITLGILLCHLKLAQFQQAFSIWNASMEESLFGIGIYGLEHAQTSVHDMLLYDFACAYLHSLSDAPKTESASAVNQYMSRVCEHMRDSGDSELWRLALSNWKQHLREIFGSSIPHSFASTLIEAEKEFGSPVPPQSIDFPKPANWARPDGFREMSRIVPFEPLEFRSVSGGETAPSTPSKSRKK